MKHEVQRYASDFIFNKVKANNSAISMPQMIASDMT